MDKASLFSQGQKYLQKGQHEKALKEFEKILELDPEDAKIHIQIGDIYNRLGRREESLEAYFKAADLFVQAGFGQKAIAVFKQALNLDPGSSEIHLKLADLYLKANLIPEAVKHFELVAQTCESDGLLDDALDIYSQLFALDPQRKHFLLKQGEILFKKGETQQAVRLLEPLEKGYAAEKNGELLVSLYELTLTYDPANLHALGELTRLLAGDKQHARIVELLQKPVENGVIQNTAVHLRLCEAMDQTGNKPGSLRQYLALYNRCQLHDPEPDLLKKILTQIVHLDPQNQQAKIDLKELSSKAQMSEESVDVPEAALRGAPPYDTDIPWRSADASPPTARQWADKVDLLLKYKIRDLAERCLREALQRFPADAVLQSKSAALGSHDASARRPRSPADGQALSPATPVPPPSPPEALEEIEVLEESPMEITAQQATPRKGEVPREGWSPERPSATSIATPAASASVEEPLEEPILLEDEAPSSPHVFEEEIPAPAAPRFVASGQSRDGHAVLAPPELDLSPMSELSGDFVPELQQEDTLAPERDSVEPAAPEQDSPSTSDDPYQQALALYFLGRYAEAIDAITSAGNGSAENGLHLLVLKLSCRRGASQWVELVDDAANALAIHSHEEDPKLYLLYEAALAYEHLGQTEDAVGCYDEIVRIRPDYQDAFERLRSLSPAPEDTAPATESQPPPESVVFRPRFNIAYI